MNYFFCDASALGKRYVPEAGSTVMNHLFASVPHDRLVMLTQGLGESTDALVLASALDLATTLSATGHSLVLIAADARLLRAATVEGLAVFNPETDTVARLDALITASP